MPKYNHIENIPAKVFFEILTTKDYQKLKPRPRERGLDRVYLSIYDDFFIRSNNDQAEEYLRLQNTIAENEYKIGILKQSLAFYYYNQTTKEMRSEFLKSLKIGYGIEIDESLPFREEVSRVLTIEVGYLENEITIAKIGMDEMKSASPEKEIDFYDMLVGLANVLVGNTLIKDDMTLAVFVALRKSVDKKSEKK